jgi:hypothetical protein
MLIKVSYTDGYTDVSAHFARVAPKGAAKVAVFY